MSKHINSDFNNDIKLPNKPTSTAELLSRNDGKWFNFNNIKTSYPFFRFSSMSFAIVTTVGIVALITGTITTPIIDPKFKIKNISDPYISNDNSSYDDILSHIDI
tara:strand:- start:1259 stop:1573 length:315 start_codon:yes stop_codon:yes gene_type:complete